MSDLYVYEVGKMKLPLRMQTAEDLLVEYMGEVNSKIGIEEDGYTELINQLKELLNQAEETAAAMYASLGYTNGDYKQREEELNRTISELQQETSFLNGKILNDVIVRKLREAIAYNPKYQGIYDELIRGLTKTVDEEIDKTTDEYLEAATKAIYEELGFDLKDRKIIIDENGYAMVEGKEDKKGRYLARDAQGRFAPKINLEFYKTSKKLQKMIAARVNNADAFIEKKGKKEKEIIITEGIKNAVVNFNEKNEIEIKADFSFEEILSIMRLSPEKLKLFPDYKNLIQQVNEAIINFLLSQSSTLDKSLFKECILQMIKDKEEIFIVSTPNNLTGILGEIQSLYFIRRIIRDKKKSKDVFAHWVGGLGNPHADLILQDGAKYFGIQVKNTTKEEAVHNINFQSFKTEALKTSDGKSISFSFNKEESEIIAKNKNYFDAVASLLGMEMFNIEYITKKNVDETIYEPGENEIFHPVRLQIEEAANAARIAVNSFIVGMMYMQFSAATDIESASNANTLYIIGGKLAISSATILSEEIEKIKEKLSTLRSSLTSKKIDKIPKITTIADFFNSQSHHNQMQVVLNTSYTF